LDVVIRELLPALEPNCRTMPRDTMQLQEQSAVVPETTKRDAAIGIAQALSLLLLGLLFATVIKVIGLEAGLPFYSAPSILSAQILGWWFVIWAGANMGGDALRAVMRPAIPGRLIAPVILASLGASIVLPQLAHLLPMPDSFVEQARKFESMGAVPLAISVGLIAPIAEEMFFRGIALRGFRIRYSARKAVWASAILFAVAHLNPWQGIIALPLGLAYACIVIRTGSIWPGVLSHAIVNLSYNAIRPILEWNGYSSTKMETMLFLPLPMLAAGMVALVAGGIWVARELGTHSRAEAASAQS
jgi:membrane protease YdiL (CAAX protease family)